jgi:excinuclease ABC subunit B
VSEYEPKGDQPTAIKELVEGVSQFERNQVLLGVTGSGKTYTAAQVIAATAAPGPGARPQQDAGAQLYGEFKSFFPDNAVEYFVSYYDYYQPEAYVPRTDTYIEKESSVNEQIDRMRHAATRSLLERDDVIIVASVSCIYGIGSVETYTAMTFTVQTGETLPQRQLLADLVALHYRRSDANFHSRHLPRARRHRRAVPGPLGRPRLAHLAVRRRGGVDHRVRSADRREDRRAEAHQGLLQLALRHAQADPAAGRQVHQGGAQAAP